MKNDIDSLLESMFRGGKLHFKSSAGEKGEKPAPPVTAPQPTASPKAAEPEPRSAAAKPGQLPEDPFAEVLRAQKTLNAVEKTGDSLSESLQQSIERLTKEAREDMADLEQHLRQDGVQQNVSAGNAGNAEDLDAAFETARVETMCRVLGQDSFVSALTIAFKRPFVAGTAPDAPLCRAAVLGKPGTGRHSALETLAASLGRQGVLKSPKVTTVNLGDYGTPGSEKLFVQDLYAALKGGASVVVFEHFEKCHTSVLSMVSALFREGGVPLPGRYAEQKGMLVEIGTALVPGAVSSLSGAGKYLFLLTDRDRDKLADAFGAPFLNALEDLCETGPFTGESLKAVADRALKSLCEKAKQKLGFAFTYGIPEVELLAKFYRPDRGAAAIGEAADRLYRVLSEAKLRQGLNGIQGKFSAQQGRMQIMYTQEGLETVLEVPAEESGAREAAVEAVKRELTEIVGLSTVKEYILSLEDNFKIQQMRREKGLKADSPSMHMIFTGNPGTGKTTVARVVSRYLKAIGVLAGGQLVEVTRADLVGKYVGHTAPLTQKAIQSALGGVLFIDEAYSLYRGKDDSFGLEAVDTLVKGMEDHRDDLVVILAGYSREMEEFLTANSGLKSRFPNLIDFPDYSAQELLDITKSIVRGKGYRLDPACDTPLLAYFERMQREGDPRTNGNGRMARNKVEEAVIACSRRNVKEPEETRNLELLLPVDFGFSPDPPADNEGEEAAGDTAEKME